MSRRLKSIADQRLVITGATSGIGYAIARQAAARGARCILVARYADGLQPLVDDIERRGGRAVWVAANPADAAALGRVTETAMHVFGGFDSWINNTGIYAFGHSESAVYRRVFEIAFSSVINGSLEAAEHLHGHRDGYAGTIINLGSPRTGLDGAARAEPDGHDPHPVAEFTAAFRDEMDAMDSPISVSLVRPAAFASARPGRAESFAPGGKPHSRYDPAAVARSVLHCAAHPTRERDADSCLPVGTLATRITARLSERLKTAASHRAQPINSR